MKTLTPELTSCDWMDMPKGLAFIEVERQEVDGDVDAYGVVQPFPTGNTERVLCLVNIEPRAEDGEPPAIENLGSELVQGRFRADEGDTPLAVAPIALDPEVATQFASAEDVMALNPLPSELSDGLIIALVGVVNEESGSMARSLILAESFSSSAGGEIMVLHVIATENPDCAPDVGHPLALEAFPIRYLPVIAPDSSC
jgi:hypothetical protein